MCHSFHPIQRALHSSFLITLGRSMVFRCLFTAKAADTVHKRCYILSSISRMPESFLLLSIRSCLTVYIKFKRSNVKLLQYFYISIHHIIWNQYYVPLSVIFILLAFQSLRISSLTCNVSQKETLSPTEVIG